MRERPSRPFVEPFVDAIDRPSHTPVHALSPGGGVRCHTAMTAGTTLTNGTTAEHELAALQRERAEFTNYKRRTAEEREAMAGLAAEGLIRKVLALADDFDLAIDHRPTGGVDDGWVEGIVAIDRKLRQLLESEGVTAIEAAAGTQFDPREHEAIANVPNTGRPGGEIVEELRRGYRLRDRVIRPALVAVAEHDTDTAEPTESTEAIH